MEFDTKREIWIVRAGEGAAHSEGFLEGKLVAIGWAQAGPIEKDTPDEKIDELFQRAYSTHEPNAVRVWASQVKRFVREPVQGDPVATYDRDRRRYLLGVIQGPSQWREERPLTRWRPVKWLCETPRDVLSASARNRLGAIATLFRLSEAVTSELWEKAVPRGCRARGKAASLVGMRQSWRLLSLACLVLACTPEETSNVDVSELDPEGWCALAQALCPGLEQSFVADLDPRGTWLRGAPFAELEIEVVGDGVWELTDAWDEACQPIRIARDEGVLVSVEPILWLGPEPVTAFFPVRALDSVWLVPDTELARFDLRAPDREELGWLAFRQVENVPDVIVHPLEGF